MAGFTVILFQRMIKPGLDNPNTTLLTDIIFTVLVAGAFISGINEHVKEILLVLNFDDYKKRVATKYQRLGGNPGDSDKEETA